MTTKKNISIISILLLILLIGIGIAIALGNGRKQGGANALGLGLVHDEVALGQHLDWGLAPLHTSLHASLQHEQSPAPQELVHAGLAGDTLGSLQLHA